MNRRSFISQSSILGAAIAATPSIATAATSGSKKLKVGLIGCGGRGKGAVENFLDACKILGLEGQLVATADAQQSAALAVAKKHGVDEKMAFSGFDAYHKVIASGCDYVIMATPPAFRPIHFAAAVEAGKHCFIEKPVAVDPVGCRSIIATGEKAAAKGLAVVTGTQRRHQAGYLRNKALIDAGAVGEIKSGLVQWNSRVPWIRRREAGESDAAYLARNWLNFVEMSGDHIVEQHVHNLDVAVWFLGRLPISALGFGGRARRETGNQFDFFSVDYDFGDGVRIHSQCRQIAGTYERIGETFTGTKGVVLGGGKVTGVEVKIDEIKLDSDNSMVQEHVDMIRSVVNGKPLNDAKRIADLTLVAIMGRVSAYTGEMIRWRDIAENESSPLYQLAYSPTAADFEKGDVTMPPEVAPIPGKPFGT